MSVTLDTGSTTYVWSPAQSKDGYYSVSINGVAAKMTTADMLLIIYDWLQTSQSDKVAKTSEVAALISDISLAASDIVKNIGLMNNAFDGEYFKTTLAPDGTIASNTGTDVDTKVKDSMSSKAAYISLDMAKEMVAAYGKMMAAYKSLTGSEYKDILADMNISADDISDYCKQYMFGVDWPDLSGGKVTFTGGKTVSQMVLASGMNGASGEADLTTLLAEITAYRDGWDDKVSDGQGGSTDLGILTLGNLSDAGSKDMEDTDNLYVWATVNFVFSGGEKELILDTDKNIDWNNETNQTIMALYFLNQTNLSANPAVNTMRTNGSSSANGKESFNNCMNKYNAATQTATQYASQALSTSESRQTMIDRNISTLTDTMTTLARGY